jgi:hypothetical protein
MLVMARNLDTRAARVIYRSDSQRPCILGLLVNDAAAFEARSNTLCDYLITPAIVTPPIDPAYTLL